MGEKLGETPQVCQNKATSLQFTYDSDLVKGCAELSTLIAGGFPNMSTTDKNELIKSHFSHALPAELKREVAPFVISSPHMSVSELARYAEIMRKSYYSRHAVGQVTETPTARTPIAPADATCFGCGDKGHFRSNCPKQQRRRPTTAPPQGNSRNQPAARPAQRFARNTRSFSRNGNNGSNGNARFQTDRRNRNQPSRRPSDNRNGNNRRNTAPSQPNRQQPANQWNSPAPATYPPMVQYVGMPAYSSSPLPAYNPSFSQTPMTVPMSAPAQSPPAVATAQPAPTAQPAGQGE